MGKCLRDADLGFYNVIGMPRLVSVIHFISNRLK